jgi:hypothetical protein
VDFVVDIGGKVELYEAKWTELPSSNDAVNLTFLRQIFGKSRISTAALICRARHRYPLGDGLQALSADDI